MVLGLFETPTYMATGAPGIIYNHYLSRNMFTISDGMANTVAPVHPLLDARAYGGRGTLSSLSQRLLGAG